MAKQYRFSREWGAWNGSVQDLVRVAGSLESIARQPGWEARDGEALLDVEVEYADGSQDRADFDQATDCSTMVEPGIKRFRASVSARAGRTSVVVEVREGGPSVRAYGENEHVVHSAFQTMCRAVSKGVPWWGRNDWVRIALVYSVGAVIATIFVWSGRRLPVFVDVDGPYFALAWIAFLSAFVVWHGAVPGRWLKSLEVTPPHAQTAAVRGAAWLTGVVLVPLLISVLSGG